MVHDSNATLRSLLAGNSSPRTRDWIRDKSEDCPRSKSSSRDCFRYFSISRREEGPSCSRESVEKDDAAKYTAHKRWCGKSLEVVCSKAVMKASL